MHIALIVEYLTTRDGTQRQALELARHLVELGHRVEVLASVWDEAGCFPEITAGLSMHAATRLRTPAVSPASGWHNLVRRGARASGAVYLTDYATMRQSARALGALAERVAKNCDVINPHDFGPAAWVGRDLAVRHQRPVVWQCNDPLLRWDTPAPAARPLRHWLKTMDRRHTAGIRHVTVLDHRVAEAVRASYGGNPTVVRSGVDLGRFATLPERHAARQHVGVPQNARVCLVLSFLNSPHRRAEDAIAAHAAGPDDVHLLLAGTAPSLGAYATFIGECVAKSPARGRITWVREPLANDDALRALFAASDALIFPNVQQTWGLGAIEAAAAGLALVISDGSGVSEVFAHAETALIYRGGDVAALTQALQRLWHDEGQRLAMAARGQTMVRQSFSWRKYALAMQAELAAACQ